MQLCHGNRKDNETGNIGKRQGQLLKSDEGEGEFGGLRRL